MFPSSRIFAKKNAVASMKLCSMSCFAGSWTVTSLRMPSTYGVLANTVPTICTSQKLLFLRKTLAITSSRTAPWHVLFRRSVNVFSISSCTPLPSTLINDNAGYTDVTYSSAVPPATAQMEILLAEASDNVVKVEAASLSAVRKLARLAVYEEIRMTATKALVELNIRPARVPAACPDTCPANVRKLSHMLFHSPFQPRPY
mmetsp:Transcript_381/g.978  ORF Transcript_381/g.978 Transcript_381/m.978 type:complete len:201 (+) Transcript_381:3-605(+)